mmetsp:Transcript_8780/g.17938  ORF Transcript_8780/g.17938 Transcript_8780/m.17938 type:complete len:202 (-) Transcript_8780:2429-3034(-)
MVSKTGAVTTSKNISRKNIRSQNVLIAWNANFEKLLRYSDIHGDCIVPLTWAGDPKLARWVGTQRRNYRLLKEGKKSAMTEERIRLLESIGFVWRADPDTVAERETKRRDATRPGMFPASNPNRCHFPTQYSWPGYYHEQLPHQPRHIIPHVHTQVQGQSYSSAGPHCHPHHLNHPPPPTFPQDDVIKTQTRSQEDNITFW